MLGSFFEFGPDGDDWDDFDDDEELIDNEEFIGDSVVLLSTGNPSKPTFELADLVDHEIYYRGFHSLLGFALLRGLSPVDISYESILESVAESMVNCIDRLPDMNGIYTKFVVLQSEMSGIMQSVVIFMKPRHFDVNTRTLSWYLVVTNYQVAEEVFNIDDDLVFERSKLLSDAIPDMPEAIRNVWLKTY